MGRPKQAEFWRRLTDGSVSGVDSDAVQSRTQRLELCGLRFGNMVWQIPTTHS
jgi:hypothetical protein